MKSNNALAFLLLVYATAAILVSFCINYTVHQFRRSRLASLSGSGSSTIESKPASNSNTSGYDDNTRSSPSNPPHPGIPIPGPLPAGPGGGGPPPFFRGPPFPGPPVAPFPIPPRSGPPGFGNGV
ncbi:hypothetical protein QBC38DRAFT_490392, partial [Podospora fimiseda]